MSDLTEFAGLSLAELTAEIAAMHPTFTAADKGTVNPLTADPVVGSNTSEESA